MFLAGEPWSVKVPGNAFPIAVGATLMSSEQAAKAGFRGKALRITHYYRDTLWDSAEGRYVPNGGFLEDVVLGDPEFVSSSQSAESLATEAVNLPEDSITGNNDQMCTRGDAGNDSKAENMVEGIVDDDLSKEISKEIESLKVTDEGPEEASAGKGIVGAMSADEMDMLLDKCLLQALHTTVKDKDLPMPGSTLWSNHILACRPPGITLDIKRSPHKKLSKWLHAKASTGLVSAKEDKHRKEVMLISINRGHPDYQAFKPEKRKPQAPETSNPTPSNMSAPQGLLQIDELWKSSTHVNPILEALGANTNQFYTANEAFDIVFSYVEKESLVKPNDNAMVVLDAILCDALFKGTVKKGSSYPTEIHKKDLGSTFLNRMQPHHRVTRGNETVMRKGTVKPVQIMTERRQGNKKVTRVSGLESFLIDADALASELQKKFACSTSVAELPGKKGQSEVLVQGGVLDDLARHLVQHYGIPKKYVEILDKTKK
eukprot:TRINITY_DN3005_c0_g1_i2.p1 TRINITY_DN3005_c0_g1~~TRINITY_DN3005_c0_g1_i2.p1  ORF type:complete len:487 (+),score=96.24 TRINITY_DN3005_c0_g1_i2:242-1702(+)